MQTLKSIDLKPLLQETLEENATITYISATVSTDTLSSSCWTGHITRPTVKKDGKKSSQ